MTDPYRIPDTHPRHRAGGNGPVRFVLWLLLVLSVAGNLATSFGPAGPALHATLGVVALGCGVALVVHHRRGLQRTSQ